MTLKERIKNLLSEASRADIHFSPAEYDDSDTGPFESITEEVAVKFGDWLRKQRPDTFYGHPATSDLFKLFKKQAGL